jgi:hypothetical protein
VIGPVASSGVSAAKGSQGQPAASNCWWIPSSCQSYFDPGFNRSKSLCRGTRD